MVARRRLLLRFKRNGEKVLNIQDYYERFISPRAKKFSRYSFSRSNTVVCPFHEDNDPSFGVIRGKDGVDRYHCFGCGIVGDFVDFYIGTERIFKGRSISEDRAIQEICMAYAIPVDDLNAEDTELKLTREQSLQGIKAKYSVSDFERDIRMGLLMGRPVPYYNAKLLELISSSV